MASTAHKKDDRNFFQKTWRLWLGITAVAAAVTLVLFPPALLAGLMVGLASTALFGLLGAAALPVAVAAVALGIFATLYALGEIVGLIVRKCAGPSNRHTSGGGQSMMDASNDSTLHSPYGAGGRLGATLLTSPGNGVGFIGSAYDSKQQQHHDDASFDEMHREAATGSQGQMYSDGKMPSSAPAVALTVARNQYSTWGQLANTDPNPPSYPTLDTVYVGQGNTDQTPLMQRSTGL